MSVAAPPARVARALARIEPSPPRIATALAALLLALFLVWAWLDGGFAATTWLPGALFMVALAAVVVFTRGGVLRQRPVLGAAVALFAAFTVWNGLTVLWADAAADAWDGTNRTLLYLAVFVLFATLPFPPGAVPFLLGGYALGAAALAAIGVVRGTSGADPAEWYIQGRLATPTDYANANAALFLAAVWPALYFASRREVSPVLRGVFLGAAGVLAEASLLCQSRGSLVAMPIVALLVFAFVPGRARLFVTLVPVAAAVALTGSTLLDVYSAALHENDLGVFADARRLVIVSTVALFVVGLALGLIERAFPLPARVARAGAVTLVVLVAGAVATGAVALVVEKGGPQAHVSTWWEQFKSGRRDDYRTVHLASGLGSNRYDLWRVALLEFKEAPIIGIGADNYARPYVAERRYLEEPLYPHSLPLRLLSQTGLVGTLLFTGVLVCVVLAAWRTARRASPFERGVAVAALGLAAYWLVHGAVEWFWEIPALAAPAIAALALATRVGGDLESARPGRLLRAATVAIAVLGAITLVPPYLAARNVSLAAEQWAESPELAFDRLALARRLNPLSDEPDVIAAVVAQRIDDRRRERSAWLRALERNPDNWYALLKLGLLDLSDGNRARARERVAAARALNPLEPVLALVDRRMRAGGPVTADEVDRLFLERAVHCSAPRVDSPEPGNYPGVRGAASSGVRGRVN